jgi:hypothetical protein
MVTTNCCPAKADNALHHLGVERHNVDQIASDDDMIWAELLHIFDHGFESGKIPVNIGEDGKSRQNR